MRADSQKRLIKRRAKKVEDEKPPVYRDFDDAFAAWVKRRGLTNDPEFRFIGKAHGTLKNNHLFSGKKD